MLRHFNYTKRMKVPQKSVSLRVYTGETGFQEFDLTLDLSDYGFAEGTVIFIEAYYRSAMMRFNMGAVSQQESVYHFHSVLSDLQDPQINFRIKLVDARDQIGRLIGIIDKIQTFNENSKQVSKIGLLPVKFDALDEQIWKLDFSDDDSGPVLAINSALSTGDVPIGELIRSSPLFLSLVFPQVVREIFQTILLSDDNGNLSEDDDHWSARWIHFAVSTLGIASPPQENDERRDWIDDVVNKFCARNQIRTKFEEYFLEQQNGSR